MTFKYKNVYVNDYVTIAGPIEKQGPLAKNFDKCYDDFYLEEKTFEQAEIKMLDESVNMLLKKIKKNALDIDVLVGGDLLNQIIACNYVAKKHPISFLGIYSACANSCESLLIAANMIEAKQVKNAICMTSSHNLTSERQFRNPVEYGGPKYKRSTFTSTGAVSVCLSPKKDKIRINSATLGKVVDLDVKDSNNLGAAMAPAAAQTLFDHLTETKTTLADYDLIVTGDLGQVGTKIFKEYMAKKYKLKIGSNYNDCGLILYDLENQEVFSGGSGPACAPLVTFSTLVPLMKQNKYKRVLLLATGALFSSCMVFQKQSIPCISHAISFEVVE